MYENCSNNSQLRLVYTYRQRHRFLWAAPLIYLTLCVNSSIGLHRIHFKRNKKQWGWQTCKGSFKRWFSIFMKLKNIPDDDTYTKFNLAIPFFPLRLVPVYFNTEIVPALLPVHLAVGYGEQVLDAQRLAWRQLDDGDARRHVFVLRRPVRDDVVGWRPGEISQALDFHALLVQQAKRLQNKS